MGGDCRRGRDRPGLGHRPETGRWTQREQLAGHVGDVVCAELDPAGRRLVTVSADGNVIVWDMTAKGGFGRAFPALGGRWISGRPRVITPDRLIIAPTRSVAPTAADPKTPADDTLDVAATFLDPGTGKVVDQVAVGNTRLGPRFGPAVSGSSVALSPDSRLASVTSGDATTVIDTRTRKVIQRIVLTPPGSANAELVWSSAWTPDGTRLLIGAEGADHIQGFGPGALVVIDTTSWRWTQRLDVGGPPRAMAVSPDGKTLVAAVAGQTSRLAVLDAGTLRVRRYVNFGPDYIYDLAFSSDGRRLSAGGELATLHVLDSGTWRALASTKVLDDWIMQVEWSRDDQTVVATGIDGTVGLFDVQRGLPRTRPLPASSEAGAGVTYVVPDPSRELVVLGGEHVGHRYAMTAEQWFEEACSIVGRNLTPSEWERYLPDRPPEATCVTTT